MDRIIIKVMMSDPVCFTHLVKYVKMFNDYFASRRQFRLCLESTLDSVLFFYHDFAAFCEVIEIGTNSPYLTPDLKQTLHDPFICKMFLPPSLFPKKGLTISYHVITGPAAEISSLAQQNFQRFDPTLEFRPLPSNNQGGFEMKIKSYTLIRNYTHYLIHKYILNSPQ
jgi:hypothetical protein